MNNKELARFLKKWYWKHGQRLTVNTFEDRTWQPENYCFSDVCLYDPETDSHLKWLFTIQNYNGMSDLYRTAGGDVIDYLDIVTIASRPYYINEQFFLRKWTPITDKDIYDCAKYFIDKVLDLKYEIWNIIVHPQSNAEQLELKLK